MAWLVTFNDDSSMYKLLYRVTSPQTRSNAPLQVAWTRDSWYCRQDHHSGPSWEPSNVWSVGQWDLFPTQWPSPRGSWLALDALSTVYNTKVVDFWHLTTSDSAHALSTWKSMSEMCSSEILSCEIWHLDTWDHWPGHFVTGWLSESSAVILKPPSILAEIDLIWMVATYDVPKLRVCFMYINMYDCKYVYIYMYLNKYVMYLEMSF